MRPIVLSRIASIRISSIHLSSIQLSSIQLSSNRRVRIIPVFLGLIVLGGAVALKLGVGSSHAAVSSNTAVSSTLHAFVHQNDSIGLTFDDGSPVGLQARDVLTIPPGTYTIRVIDDSDIHNFHLDGPGVDQTTAVDLLAAPTWTVTFQSGGTYRFQCDIHPDFMFGIFQATGGSSSSGSSTSGGTSSGSSSGSSSSSGSTSSGSTSPAVSSNTGSAQATLLRGTLAGTVNSNGTLKLALQGKAVSRLKSGRYKITVVDKTPARSFVVQQTGRSAITVSGVSFVGTHSVTVNLKAGQWTFYTSAGKPSKSTFVVVA
jgi:plastocyanin